MDQVSFRRMDEGTAEDYALLHRYESSYIEGLPDRLMHALEKLDDSLAGYQVSRLQHSLQSATLCRAL